ncbi:MAG: cache domain-containing protein [Elainellaceae cyanobacterium]
MLGTITKQEGITMSAQRQDMWSLQQDEMPEAAHLNEQSKRDPSHSSDVTPPTDRALSESARHPPIVIPDERSADKGIGIGIKATLLATVFGVLPAVAVGGVAYQSADRSITTQIAQEKIAEANQLSDQLSRYLQEQTATIKTVASMVNTINATTNTTTGLATFETTNDSPAISLIIDELTTFVQNYQTYENIALYTLQGNVIAQSKGSVRELNQKDAPYFQRVIETGAPVISEPILLNSIEDSQRSAIYIAAPIIDSAGQTTAVVAGKIPVEFIGNAVLETTRLQEGETFRLVDSNGLIFQDLPNLDPASLGTPIAEIMPTFSTVDEQRQRQTWIAGAGASEQLNAYSPVTGIENLEWSVVSSTDASLAFLPQQKLVRAIGLGTALTALISAVLGAILARRFTSPLQQVASAVEKLGRGDLNTRVAVRGRDEFAVLGANVNQMASQIQTLLDTVHQNAEQLSHQNDVLAALAQNEALIQGDAQEVAKAFTEAIAQTLTIERVGIWVYSSDRTQLVCLDQYEQQADHHADGDALSLSAVPEYAEAIDSAIATDNAQLHPAIASLVAAGLLSSDTQATLNIPIQISGQTAGVIRCDHLQTPRTWQADEQTFVNSVANLVSIALESEFLQEEVSHLLDVVSDVEEGNLTTQAKVSDRSTGLVADTFNRLIERLIEVLTGVVGAARQVSDAANQQRAMAEAVATNTDQQAQAVNQVLRLTEQVEQIAQGSLEKVGATITSLQTMRVTVENGQGAIATLTKGIGILQDGTDRIVQQMKTLGEFVGLADQFVQDQSQIASLTQTLALNASLVAARASEQRDPRQFAVVAREFDSIANQVSRLAQQTNEGLVTLEQRSTQIHSVVSIIDSNIQNLGGLVRGFTDGVEQSNRVFMNVQTVTDEVVEAGEAVTQSNQAITNAAQSAAQVVRDIAEIATQTAELSQRSQLQSEEMDILSNQLLQSIEFFRLPAISSGTQDVDHRIDLSDTDETTVEIHSNGTTMSAKEVGDDSPALDAQSLPKY